MLFHLKGHKMNEKIKFEDKMISNSRETKFLGIWLKDNLSWGISYLSADSKTEKKPNVTKKK